jgi:hypothetical protein
MIKPPSLWKRVAAEAAFVIRSKIGRQRGVVDVRCRQLEIWNRRFRPLVQLASDNSKLIRSVDTDCYAITMGLDDDDRNPVTDVNHLARLSAEYQHNTCSLKDVCQREASRSGIRNVSALITPGKAIGVPQRVQRQERSKLGGGDAKPRQNEVG